MPRGVGSVVGSTRGVGHSELGMPVVNAGDSKEGDGNGDDSSGDSQKNQTLLKKRKGALLTRKCHWLRQCEAVRGFPNHHTTPVAIYRSW